MIFFKKIKKRSIQFSFHFKKMKFSGNRSPAGPRALLRWFQSGRNRLGRIKKVWLFSNCYGGVMVQAAVSEAREGGVIFPAGPCKSTFNLFSEWKKPIRKNICFLLIPICLSSFQNQFFCFKNSVHG